MPNDNLTTLVAAEVLSDNYIKVQAFINQINELSEAEVQALIDLRKNKVDGLHIHHEDAIDPQFC
jgi:hypothetical protein